MSMDSYLGYWLVCATTRHLAAVPRCWLEASWLVLVVGGLGGLGGGEGSVPRADMLVAVGRTSNIAGIGLELADVEPTEAGYVKVDGHLRTGPNPHFGRAENRSS
jgi:hypothetical protein